MTFGILRVKNEARWIERIVASLQPVCERILILDDHSTDATPDLCMALGCTVFRSHFTDLHEARDKDFLLEQVWDAGAQVGDYCIMVDGDEELFSEDVPELRAAMQSGVVCGSMHVLYLWDNEQQIRIDRWYREVRRPSLFRLIDRNLTFKRTQFGGNLHCSSAPVQVLERSVPLKVRLLHYGYLHREDRVRKFHWYNSIDPHNTFEDEYRHMVVGDLFPANSKFRWAGPLELKAI
jgi:glycosyltransferase involved in cell wall biosynthesis